MQGGEDREGTRERGSSAGVSVCCSRVSMQLFFLASARPLKAAYRRSLPSRFRCSRAGVACTRTTQTFSPFCRPAPRKSVPVILTGSFEKRIFLFFSVCFFNHVAPQTVAPFAP